ncbi:DUF4184 family protein [Kitasatospora cinereorecta]|uniref:DUF4184 family protein n=1 Tax=Kitasatospora cinereorecta TaxID=285560 RepID=A0ABW0VAD2_9ACTN
MPFTLSHVAAVLPLVRDGRGRGQLVAAGLVTGAMVPDLPYFADSLLRGTYRYGCLTHRWWAAPTVDVALSAALVAGARALWRVPGESGRPGWFAVSAALGAATHLGWDAFTHEGRAGVRVLPVLARPVAGVPLYTVLQYGTSLLGLAVLARRYGPPRAVDGRTAAVLGGSALLGAGHRLARRERGWIDELCFGAGTGAAVGAALLAFVGRRAGAPGGTGRPGPRRSARVRTGSPWRRGSRRSRRRRPGRRG